MKKIISALLALTMMLIIMFAAPSIKVSAAIGDGSKLSADINLQVGRYNTATKAFNPLKADETLKTGDIITVRICPKSDFLCGATEYVVMFDKLYFSIQGANNQAFTPNTENTFYAQTAAGYAGATKFPDTVWPASFGAAENYNVYQAVKVGNQADSNSANGGYPNLLPGTWLFQFNLKVLKDINAGANARIWMDKSWFRSPAYTTGAAYFAKCLSKNQLSSSGLSTTYNFKLNLNNADIKLPLTSALPTEPAETTQSNTKIETTSSVTTVSGTTGKGTTKSGTTSQNTTSSLPSANSTSAAAGTTEENTNTSGNKGTVIIATAVIAVLAIALAAVYLTKKKK